MEQVKVEDCVLEEEKLIKEQEEIRTAVIDLNRLAQIKADEREQKSRDFMRAEVSGWELSKMFDLLKCELFSYSHNVSVIFFPATLSCRDTGEKSKRSFDQRSSKKRSRSSSSPSRIRQTVRRHKGNS